MSRRAAGLTARRVQTQRDPGLFGDGGGLYLQVAPSGAKTWIFRFQLAGRRRDMGLGSANLFSLAEVRGRAFHARRLVADGIDPIEQRAAAKVTAKTNAIRGITFRECAERYIAAHRLEWRNPKYAAQWPSTLESYAFPHFGALAVSTIDTGSVLQALEPIWTKKPETAARVRGRVEAILDWAAAREYRSPENPARWRGHLDKLLPKRSKIAFVGHHPALRYTEIVGFMTDLRQQEGIAARALEFAILTVARTGEVVAARWVEVDMGAGIWTIPAERMKAGREHRVPLPAAAFTILERMASIRLSEWIFPGAKEGKPLSNMALLMTLRRMERVDLTVHGFRSTFRDWAAERTGFPAEVAEMALAHRVGDKVEAAYRRGDLFEKRRLLAEAWANYCFAAPN
jgi:integrase